MNKNMLVLAIFLMMGPINAFAAGPAPVSLLSAGNFTILTKTGITDTGSHATVIKGNVGSSPITAAAMSTVFCPQVTGTMYGVDAAYVGNGNMTCFAGNPPLFNKTLVDGAVLDMSTAYNDAIGRTNPTATELGAGAIGGITIAPGLYKWSSDVLITSDVTLSGSESDIWIFQIAGDLTLASAGSVPTGIKINLAGGAQAANVFWQVGGITGATLGTYSTFNGTILAAKQVVIQTGAILNGRALAQTQVTLDADVITFPTPTAMHGVLAVTSLQALDDSGVADNTFENGWKYAMDVTVPDKETAITMKFADWTGTGVTIPAAGNVRISCMQADNTNAAIVMGSASEYSSPALRMTQDLDPALPGLQTRIMIETKIPIGAGNGRYGTRYGLRSSI